MKNAMTKVSTALTQAMLNIRARLVSMANSEDGIDIIIMIVVLAILIGIAILFRDKLGAFVEKLFDEILSFQRDCYEAL
ncbi:MAG: hypothetical protein J6A55_04045 [Oscillospiraceae bacterium]|nr:hypothetical protein [Oscillospiraceae bacterium]